MTPRLPATTAIALGAALLSWPALVNGYPVLFSDTAGLAAMATEPTIGWDKPWVYGPFMLLAHLGVSLWGVVVAQALLASAVLWLVLRVVGAASLWRHAVLCGVLAVGSAAPWFTALLMPDIFAPLCVLCVFVLAYGRALPLPDRAFAGAVGTLAIASHLAHLVLAAGCLAAVLLLRPRRLPACAAPLGAALALLVSANAIGNGVLGVSPYGSIFALARLQADGPAADTLHARCPEIAPRFCRWQAQLPMESDAFLWHPEGPIWADESGPTLIAAEASAVVRATLLADPVGVAAAAAANTLRQLGRVEVGDTLSSVHLEATVGRLLRLSFPAAEQARFAGSAQLADRLDSWAAPLRPLHWVLLVAGALGTVAVALGGRRWPALGGLAAVVLAGVLANAAATGALSGPHDRYGARIAWLVLVPPLAWLLSRPYRPRTSAS